MNPLLKALIDRALTPLAPQPGQLADKAATAITTPTLSQSPTMAKLKGFGAGALQGAGHLLSDMTKPLNIGIGAASGGLGGLLDSGAAGGASEAAGALAPRMFNPVAETLGEVAPDFTPVGGEGLYNAGKAAAKPATDPVIEAYTRILANGGR